MAASFWKLFLGSSVSRLGTAFSIVAIMARFYDLTGSAHDWGILVSVRAIPFILFGLVAGPLVDRFNRKYILLVCDFARVFTFLALAFCNDIGWFYGLVFLSSIFSVPYEPCIKSLTVSWVERDQLLRVNSLTETARSIVTIFGLALAGILVRTVGAKWCLIFDAATYLFAAINASVLAGFAQENSREFKFSVEDHWKSIKDGLTFIKNKGDIFYPIFIWTLMIFLIGFEGPMFFPLVEEKKWGGADLAGLIVACIAIGSLLTSLIISRLKKLPINNVPTATCVLLFDAMAIYLIANATSAQNVFIFAIVLGITETLFNTYAITEIQTKTPEDMVGRVFSAVSSIQEPLRVSGIFAAGILMQNFLPSTTLNGAAQLEFGIAVIIMLIWLLRTKTLGFKLF